MEWKLRTDRCCQGCGVTGQKVVEVISEDGASKWVRCQDDGECDGNVKRLKWLDRMQEEMAAQSSYEEGYALWAV